MPESLFPVNWRDAFSKAHLYQRAAIEVVERAADVYRHIVPHDPDTHRTVRQVRERTKPDTRAVDHLEVMARVAAAADMGTRTGLERLRRAARRFEPQKTMTKGGRDLADNNDRIMRYMHYLTQDLSSGAQLTLFREIRGMIRRMPHDDPTVYTTTDVLMSLLRMHITTSIPGAEIYGALGDLIDRFAVGAMEVYHLLDRDELRDQIVFEEPSMEIVENDSFELVRISRDRTPYADEEAHLLLGFISKIPPESPHFNEEARCFLRWLVGTRFGDVRFLRPSCLRLLMGIIPRLRHSQATLDIIQGALVILHDTAGAGIGDECAGPRIYVASRDRPLVQRSIRMLERFEKRYAQVMHDEAFYRMLAARAGQYMAEIELAHIRSAGLFTGSVAYTLVDSASTEDAVPALFNPWDVAMNGMQGVVSAYPPRIRQAFLSTQFVNCVYS